MKRNIYRYILLVSILGFGFISKASNISLQVALNKANTENKIVLLEIGSLEKQTIWKDTNSDFIKDKFINIQLSSSSSEYNYIKNKYNLNSPNCRLYLNKNGMLLLPVEYNYNLETLEKDCRMAACKQDEPYPLAQMDLDYSNGTLSKNELFEYILKRSRFNLDISDLIDLYAREASKKELLSKTTLDLFIASSLNLDGAFYAFIENNRDEVINTLHWNKLIFESFVRTNFKYSFKKICEEKSENRLLAIITKKKKATINADIHNTIEKKYLTEYYYHTKQALKLANLANDYASSLIIENKENLNNKEDFAYKLRDVAQYVVETLSQKSMLTKALSWTSLAGELLNSFSNYETQAYLLYKLGKRAEAINCMEKAYTMAPKESTDYEHVGERLIKMKRGERIF